MTAGLSATFARLRGRTRDAPANAKQHRRRRRRRKVRPFPPIRPSGACRRDRRERSMCRASNGFFLRFRFSFSNATTRPSTDDRSSFPTHRILHRRTRTRVFARTRERHKQHKQHSRARRSGNSRALFSSRTSFGFEPPRRAARSRSGRRVFSSSPARRRSTRSRFSRWPPRATRRKRSARSWAAGWASRFAEAPGTSARTSTGGRTRWRITFSGAPSSRRRRRRTPRRRW